MGRSWRLHVIEERRRFDEMVGAMAGDHHWRPDRGPDGKRAARRAPRSLERLDERIAALEADLEALKADLEHHAEAERRPAES